MSVFMMSCDAVLRSLQDNTMVSLSNIKFYDQSMLWELIETKKVTKYNQTFAISFEVSKGERIPIKDNSRYSGDFTGLLKENGVISEFYFKFGNITFHFDTIRISSSLKKESEMSTFNCDMRVYHAGVIEGGIIIG